MRKVIEFVLEDWFYVLHTLVMGMFLVAFIGLWFKRRAELRAVDEFLALTLGTTRENRRKSQESGATSSVQANQGSSGSADYPGGEETALEAEKQGNSEEHVKLFTMPEEPTSKTECSPFAEGWPFKAGTLKDGCSCATCESGRKAMQVLKVMDADPEADVTDLMREIPRASMQIASANSGCPCEKCAALRVRLNDRRIDRAGFYDKGEKSEYEKTGVLGTQKPGQVLVNLMGGPFADKQVWVNAPEPGHGLSFMLGTAIGQLAVYVMSCDLEGGYEPEMMFLGFEGQPIVKEFMKERGMPVV